MSWDIEVEIDTGNGNTLSGECRNYTHNCNSMMRLALAETGDLLDLLGEDHLYALDGRPCQEVGPYLQRAVAWWSENQSRMAELEPANGWGDSETALEFWTWVANECQRHPRAKLRVSG